MDPLFPFGKLDVLYFYTKVSPALRDFLKNREIASKIHIGEDFFIRRGSKDEPLFIEELCSEELNDDFFKLRSEISREEAIKEGKISKLQAKIWLYFPPTKYVELFYACNGEKQGKPIERIFIDVDRVNLSSEEALKVTKELIKIIEEDEALKKLIHFETKILWTGSSFHIYLFLNKSVSSSFYNRYFSYSKTEPLESFIGRWADEISKKTGIDVIGGHEKKKNFIVLDPSQTPSGKLARAPFSLHYSEGKIDGICVPLNKKQLQEKNILKKLRTLTAKKVLEQLSFWKNNL